MSIGSDDYFIPVEQAKQYVTDELANETFWSENQFLLLKVKEKGEKAEYVFQQNLQSYLHIARNNLNITKEDYARFRSTNNLFAKFIKISSYTALYLSNYSEEKPLPAFVQTLLYYMSFTEYPQQLDETYNEYSLMGVTIVTYEKMIKNFMEGVLQRWDSLNQIKQSNFINTASYMGNKKKLAGFIVEAMFPHISSGCAFIDLMCGSGAMSQAFAQLGSTYASDAQEFCQLLAKIQGGGFTRDLAAHLLKQMTPYYIKHYDELTARYQKQVQKEAELYHQNWSDKEAVYTSYIDYVNQFELYSSTMTISDDLKKLVEEHRINNKRYPYCLFTLYFSNVYFGLLQCIQLDSLRYAVDQLRGEEHKWALGVLIATTYQISAGHAGHFAQPKNISKDNIIDILASRQKSAYHEFSKRFLCLAEESQLCPNTVQIIPGPWQVAMTAVTRNIAGPKVVYLDAPYKRDEYSRYYHVLETMAKYDYPSSELKGRVRSKKLGERFSTEFFTKTASKVEETLVKIIGDILSLDMICVWSYSDNAQASIINIINIILNKVTCRVYLYGMPYEHKSQRGSTHNVSVTEYCIIFVPCESEKQGK